MAAAPVPPPEGPEQSAAQPGIQTDPYRAYNFKLDTGIGEGRFTYCSGLGVKIDAIQYREGGGGHVVRQIPGQVTYAYVTLKYGVTDSREVWDWFMLGVQGNVERRNITVSLLSPDGSTPVINWNLINAWPKEWTAAPLDALSRDVLIASVTFAFDELKIGT